MSSSWIRHIRNSRLRLVGGCDLIWHGVHIISLYVVWLIAICSLFFDQTYVCVANSRDIDTSSLLIPPGTIIRILICKNVHLQSHPWILEPVFEVGDDDVPKAARNSSNDHVDRIIDQRDHDNPQTSEHLWSPRLCRTTSSRTRMPNTTARPRRQTVYGHLQQAQFWQSFSSQHHCPQYHHPQHAHHPQSLAAPMAAHGRTPSMVISPRSVGGVIVPRPESSENWLNTRPGLSGPPLLSRVVRVCP